MNRNERKKAAVVAIAGWIAMHYLKSAEDICRRGDKPAPFDDQFPYELLGVQENHYLYRKYVWTSDMHEKLRVEAKAIALDDLRKKPEQFEHLLRYLKQKTKDDLAAAGRAEEEKFRKQEEVRLQKRELRQARVAFGKQVGERLAKLWQEKQSE